MSQDKLPLAVEIEINHDCNRACPYCPNSRTARTEEGSMDPALFRRLMEQLRDLGFSGRISYHFYNEPLLCKDLDLFVAMTREHLPRSFIELYTNGTLLDPERIRRLFALGVSKFRITEHAKVRLDALRERIAALPEEDRSRIHLLSFRELPLTNRGGLVSAGKRDVKPPFSLPCFIPYCAVVVTLKGNVVPCYEDYHQHNAMGNILDRPFGEIWNSDRYRSFREDLKKGKRSCYQACDRCNNLAIIS